MEKNYGKSSMMMLIAAVTVLAAIIGGYFVYKSQSTDTQMGNESMEETHDSMMDDSKTTDTMMNDENPTTNDSMMGDESMMGDIKVVNVEGGSYYFKPNIITVKKGREVKVVLSSADMMHNFVIDEFNVKSDIVKSGNTTEVTFTPDKVGEFEFYCSVGNHRAQGMVGTLIVKE